MSVTIRAEVDAGDIARVARVLRNIEPDLIADLRQTMRGPLFPIAQRIAARANSYPVPMSGMLRAGVRKPIRTVWGALRITPSKISVTPGRSRRSPSLVTMNFDGSRAVGLVIAENAGTKTQGSSLRGKLFIERINATVPGWQNGGRYLYRAFMPYKSHVYQLGENLLQRWIAKTNRVLESR